VTPALSCPSEIPTNGEVTVVAKLRSRLTYANVVSTLCLFIVLGGTSYAVATGSINSREIKNNTVRSKDIRNNSVRSRDVRDLSLLARDFKPGQLPRGPRGFRGLRGPRGAAGTPDVRVRIGNAGAGTPTATSDAACQGGRATGGGVSGSGPDDYVIESAPTAGGAAGPIATTGAIPDGWRASARDSTGNAASVRAYVICAP
jgi:hypothetical protein